MALSSMNISLPKSLRSYVASRVENGDYSTPSEFVRDLIRRNREQEELERKLLEGMRSAPVPAGKEFWTELRRTAHARQAGKRRARRETVAG